MLCVVLEDFALLRMAIYSPEEQLTHNTKEEE